MLVAAAVLRSGLQGQGCVVSVTRARDVHTLQCLLKMSEVYDGDL